MYVFPHAAKRYLAEARESLERLKNPRDGDDLQRGLVLFLESTKHVTIQLQSGFRNKVEGFDAWWDGISKGLDTNPLCKYFYKLRNRVVKDGENVIKVSFEIIGPGTIHGPAQINNEGVFIKVQKGDSYEWVPKKDVPGMRVTEWRFSDYPKGYSSSTDPVIMCQEYLVELEKVVDDFVAKFGRDR